MPAELEGQAKTLNAFQRKRGVASANELLRAILAYVIGLMSVQEWSAADPSQHLPGYGCSRAKDVLV